MRVMIAAKEGTEILVDILNQSFSVGKIKEICGQDKFSMPNGYTDFSRYAGLHKNDGIGEGKYADMTYGEFLLKLGSFTGKGGYLDRLIRENMKPFMEGDDPGKRLGLFNRLYPGLMKYFRKDFGNLFENFNLNKPVMNTHYTTMMTDIAVIMDAIFGNHGRYLRDMNSAINRFVAGNLDLDQFRSELNSIQDSMSGSGESNGTAVEKAEEDAWNRLNSSCRMDVPGVDPKYTWYKVDNYEDLWPVATKPVTDWCVAQKGSSGQRYFNHYGAPYYMMCDGRHPVALLHVDSRQFKDAEDHPIRFDRPSKLKFVESGMKLLEKLDYSGGYRGDLRVFQEYLDDANGFRKDYNDDMEDRISPDDMAISPDDMEDRISLDAMAAISDNEFAKRLGDPDFFGRVIDFLYRNDMNSVFSKIGRSKFELLAGRSLVLDERLLRSSEIDEGMVFRIISEEIKHGWDMNYLFRLAMENADDSRVLKIMERFLCPDLAGVICFYSWSSNENAEKAARIILDGEDRIGRDNLLSVLSHRQESSITIPILRDSEDSEIIDAASESGMDWIRNGDYDDVLWNIVRNGGKKSHENLLESCPEKLNEEMSDHLLDRHSKDRDMIEEVITRASLSKVMIDKIAGLGDKSMDRLLLKGQVLDDGLVLRLIDELGDEYQGELRCKKNGKFHKYSPEVVDAALEAALINDREESIVETQDLSEENIRAVVKNGGRLGWYELMDTHRLPKDLIEEVLSDGDYDVVLAINQPLDDGQIDELVRRHGDKAVKWIARNDRIAGRHAYKLISENLDSEETCSSLLKRKSIDWRHVLPWLLKNHGKRRNPEQDEILLRAVRELNNDKVLLLIVSHLDFDDFCKFDMPNKIIDEILGKDLSKKLSRCLLRCNEGIKFAYHMVNGNRNLNQDNLHYIAEHFVRESELLASNSGKIRLDKKTVKLLKRWRDGRINAELLEHGYLDKDMDADEVPELLDRNDDDEYDFIFNLRDTSGLGDGFIEYAVRNDDRKLARGLCRNRYLNKSQVLRLLAMDPKDKEMRKMVANNNGTEEVIRMFEGTDDPDMISGLMDNDNADESVLKEVCSTYRGEMTNELAKEMDYRFGLIPPIEKSDFLFDVLRDSSDGFKDERELVRLYGIGDEDVKWLCRKLCWENLGKRLPVPKSRMARIAGRICRRIVRMNRIAERISR